MSRVWRWISVAVLIGDLSGLVPMMTSPAEPTQIEPPVPTREALEAPGIFLSWDRFLPSGQQRPLVTRFCWGAYGHSGAIDFNSLGLYNLGVDVYRKALALRVGDVLDLHVHAWQAPVPEALLEIAHGPDTLRSQRLQAGSSLRLAVDHAMLVRVDFQPVPPREEWRFQGTWSLFWKIQHHGIAPDCRPEGPCGPDTAPCMDRARIQLRLEQGATGPELRWTFGASYDLFEIDMTQKGQPFQNVVWLPGTATSYPLAFHPDGKVYFRVWGHQRWASPVSSNVTAWPP